MLCLYSVLRRAILVRYFFGPLFQALTCMFLELLKQLFPIFVLRDVANKKTVVIVRYGNTNSFAFPQLIIIQLKIMPRFNEHENLLKVYRVLTCKS